MIDISGKRIFIVESGFQLMPKGDIQFMTVTESRAVEQDECIFCTESWLEKVKKMEK